MKLSKIVRSGVWVAVTLVGALILAAACGSGAEPEVEDTVEATATPAPEITLEELVASAGEQLAAIRTTKFEMVDEKETGSKFFGMTLKSVEGEIKSPDGFKMLVNVENPSFGFVVIEMTALGEDAFIKFAADAPWLPLPLEEVPFNFAGIGTVLSLVLPAMENAEITGRESIGGVESIRVQGDAVSEDLRDLITSVDPGHEVRLGFWFSEADHAITQFQILGKIFADDAAETSRLIKIRDINLPLEIQVPETASQP